MRHLVSNAHVHFVHLDQLEVPHSYLEVLSQKERSRACRFINPLHAQRYIWSRIVLRYLIATYLNIEPSVIVFDSQASGKPILAGQHAKSQLQFSISHAKNGIALAVSRNQPIGVDLEFIRENINALAVAKRFFTEKEFLYLQSLKSDSLRIERFFHLWIGKEAFVKAIGTGIAGFLDQVEVLLGQVPLIELKAKLYAHYPGGFGWLNYFAPFDGYLAAVVQAGSRSSPTVFCSNSKQWFGLEW